jgi:hypothetical protein
MCEQQPKFKEGAKAEHRISEDVWERVAILSLPLRHADPRITVGNLYLVGDGKVRFLTNENNLRPVERWVKCDGKHRFADRPEGGQPTNMERLVE